jgi:hypothetical protein
MKLLSRDEFREGVFARDKHKCVICGNPAQDAHHILERRLWPDGGYYLENGASLCGEHHIKAEETTLSCEEIREACGIDRVILPEHLYDDQTYDKWGNPVLPNGTRLKGDLYYDESVQKILDQGGVLQLFSKYVKYPRTYHLPWSNLLKDDRLMKDDSCFNEKEVVVTLKMDGENTTMYNDYIHARSINSGSHATRDRVKGIWSQISYLLDDDMRLCGENLYAVHTVKYENLPSYFMIFSIWIGNTCLSWNDTIDFAGVLGLEVVPVIYSGKYDAGLIREAFKKYEDSHEGYVVRLAEEFKYGDFRKSVGKFVRPEFRQMLNNSHGHWISKKIETNKLS